MILVVHMPPAAARDELAVAAELSHLREEVAKAGTVLVVWRDEVKAVKQPNPAIITTFEVRLSRSLALICGCGHQLDKHDDPESSDGFGCRFCQCQAFHRVPAEEVELLPVIGPEEAESILHFMPTKASPGSVGERTLSKLRRIKEDGQAAAHLEGS